MKTKTTALITAAFLVTACGEAENPNRVVGELASDRIELTAEFNEPITAIHVVEGEVIASGQLLVEQDSRRAAARLAEAEAALAQQQARLDELVRGPRSEQIAAARAELVRFAAARLRLKAARAQPLSAAQLQQAAARMVEQDFMEFTLEDLE